MAPCTVHVQSKETQSSVTISFSLFTVWSCKPNLIRRHTEGFKEYSAFFIFLCKPWLIVPEQQLKLYTPSENWGCNFLSVFTQTVAQPPQAAGVSASVSEEEPRERAGVPARRDPESEGGKQSAAAAAGPEPAAASRGAHWSQPAARDHPAH